MIPMIIESDLQALSSCLLSDCLFVENLSYAGLCTSSNNEAQALSCSPPPHNLPSLS